MNQLKQTTRQLTRITGIVWRTARVELYFEVVMAIGRSLTPIACAILYKLLIDKLVASGIPGVGSGQWQAVFLILAGYMGALFISEVSMSLSSVTSSLIIWKCAHVIQKLLMKKKQELDQIFFDDAEFRNLVTKAEKGASTDAFRIVKSLLHIGSSLVLSIEFTIILLRYNYMVAVLIIAAGIPALQIGKIAGKVAHSLANETAELTRKHEYFTQLLVDKDAAAEIRVLNAGGYFLDRYSGVWQQFLQADNRCLLRTQLLSLAKWLCQNALYYLFYMEFMFAALDGRISIGDFTLYTHAIGVLSSSIGSIMSSFAELYGKSLFIEHFTELLGYPTAIVNETSICTGRSFVRNGGLHSIEFQNVCFRYPGMQHNVLEGLSFYIAPGESVALVGLNGAGKSTLVKLLMRLYDPVSGKVLIDGIDVREYNPLNLYACWGTVFQDYGRYSLNVGENIWLGNTSTALDVDRMYKAAQESGCSSFVNDLPAKYETQLTRRFFMDSVELSVGQWQRLALARSFYRDSEVVILDEPSASLDVEAEHLLFNDMRWFRQGKTAVLISHRLSSTRGCDRILLLKDGRILERGSHQELMHLESEYARLFKMQSQRYISGEAEVR